MVGNNDVNHSSISISNFVLIKAFDVKISPPRAPNIKEVIWSPPSRGWLKCNCDEAYSPDTNDNGCGDIVRNNCGDFLLALAIYLLSGSFLYVEFSAILKAIDIAKDQGWRKLWI
ncbi:unnamed protein product [Lathyrus oleraceus]